MATKKEREEAFAKACPESSRILKEDALVERVLDYMGVQKENFNKSIAYWHWHRFVTFIKENSGKNWKEEIRPKLRSYVGIDYRYLEAFLESCIAWKVMILNNGKVEFLGIPEKRSNP
jgi:hypothetical protein